MEIPLSASWLAESKTAWLSDLDLIREVAGSWLPDALETISLQLPAHYGSDNLVAGTLVLSS